MQHISATPFGSRPVSAGLVRAIQLAETPAPLPQVNKWEVLRLLCTAREAFGLSDRDLSVLNALVSFHRGNMLCDDEPLVVFPSNRTLSGRAHGMAESTLRRHLSALVDAGVILRRDSPNGKRYAHKNRSGEVMRAFGFDLRPLMTRIDEIAEKAQDAEDRAMQIKSLRTEITVLKRDALKFVQYGQEQNLAGEWDDLLAALMDVHKVMRRKLSFEQLEIVAKKAGEIRDTAADLLKVETSNLSGNDSRNERHYQSSQRESYESKEGPVEKVDSCQPTALPLGVVVEATPDLASYAQETIRDWITFVRAVAFVRGMLGISLDAYHEAINEIGQERTAIVIACLLQRIDHIKNPGGYLRKLIQKAKDGTFSEGPMVMALLNRRES